jgi:predicted nucleic acid-binding protein
MLPVFADTGFWIALFHKKDNLHLQAIELYRQIQQQKRRIITSEMVLTEVLNFFSKFSPPLRTEIANTIKAMIEYPNISVIPQDSQHFQTALNLYLQRADKAWSLTDCNSFLIMESLGLKEVLAHDHHFSQAGFIPLLKDLTN